MHPTDNGEMTWIAPRLWQGSRPLCDTDLRKIGVDVLVLAAMEHAPPASCFRGVRVFHAALDDSGPPPTPEELRQANAVAFAVARLYRKGARVLITCFAGRNRSGLITALVLRDTYGISGKAAVELVKEARPHALTNPHFCAYLESLPALWPSGTWTGVRPELAARVADFRQQIAEHA